MKRTVLFVSLLGVNSVAIAQTLPTEPQPALPPAAAPAPTMDAEPVAAPTEAAPVVAAEPVPPAAPAASAAPTQKDDTMQVTYNKGMTFASADEAFSLRATIRTQLRAQSERSLADGAEFVNRFALPRLRFSLEGHVFDKSIRTKLEFALGDATSFSFVRDVYLEKKVGKVWLRGGQWKRPFHRQELMSDFAQMFGERALTAELAGGGRDLGIAVHNDMEKSPAGLEYMVGVFNGFSGGKDRPVISPVCELDGAAVDCSAAAPTGTAKDADFAGVARVGWNHGAIKGYSGGDLEGGPLRAAVAASYKVGKLGGDVSHGAGVDLMVKVNGYDVEAAGVLTKLGDADPEIGAHLQAGYFVVPKHWNVSARAAFVPAGDNQTLEGLIGATYFAHGHSLKVLMEAGGYQVTGEDASGAAYDPTIIARATVQAVF